MSEFKVEINGTSRKVEANPEEPLLSIVRDRLGLTGTKYGCGEGQCGACTVLIEGQVVRSCQMPISSAAGKKITTIEGLESDGKLTVVQDAFLAEGAFQCGYCTSGMIVAATALLHETSNPSSQQIVTAMNHNVCRCGTYPRILAAIQRASKAVSAGGA
jgi:aerobic-type carbon monoxide dehydrogenase small subunit (CoxS/CutS family)